MYLKDTIFRQLLSSDNFNNNSFYLNLYPHGTVVKPSIALYIACIHIPCNLTSIDLCVTCTFKYGSDTIKYRLNWDNVTRNTCERKIFRSKQPKNVWALGELMFDIELNITNIYTANKTIERTQWDKYGIVL